MKRAAPRRRLDILEREEARHLRTFAGDGYRPDAYGWNPADCTGVGFAVLFPELVTVMFDLLDPQDRFRVGSVNKHWRMRLYGYVKTLEINSRAFENPRSLKDRKLRDISVFYALQELSIVNANYLTNQTIPHLFPLQNLTKLVVHSCSQILLTGFPFLCKLKTLTSLVLDDSLNREIAGGGTGGFRRVGFPETDKALTYAIEHWSKLKELSLRRWNFGKKGLEAISKLKNLKLLDLSFWQVSASRPMSLSILSAGLGSLETLILQSCHIARACAPKLELFTSLKCLDVSNNKILSTGGLPPSLLRLAPS
eukprot:TRINITY_DN5370_c0_g1_i1.p1 TRINITY_DN5370_c0_g1~~TRINITY_DN5370_c0_g1_i1.p1  ORF type:complete len:336 (+),score=34.39 TRINITY_DN5370_c0_g1_i1:81-1010(+)